ncbi:MAG: rhomboid family intramembrane serine protease [Sphingomonadales bacterium]
MFPLRDENPTIRTPYFTVIFMVISIAIFFIQNSMGDYVSMEFIYTYGFIPSKLFSIDGFEININGPPPYLTILSSMFLHGGWMHLIGNMVFLWIFGNNVEDTLGHGRFILFYLLCGLVAALVQMFSDPGSEIPMVGASGAVSGIMGAYIILYPRAKILTLLFLGIFITTMRISAGWFLGVWFALQSFNALSTETGTGGVAFWAHVGGFIAGIVLLFFIKPKSQFSTIQKKGPWG